MKRWIIPGVIGIAVLLLAAIFYWLMIRGDQKEATMVQNPPAPTESAAPPAQEETTEPATYQNIKTPHFVSSEPANNAILTAGPSQVKIDFNFDVAAGSKITVMANGNLVNTSEATKISADKLSLIQTINPLEPANYQVTYTACWPDGSCHDGSFGFTVKTP